MSLTGLEPKLIIPKLKNQAEWMTYVKPKAVDFHNLEPSDMFFSINSATNKPYNFVPLAGLIQTFGENADKAQKILDKLNSIDYGYSYKPSNEFIQIRGQAIRINKE